MPETTVSATRYDRLDALRGVAIVWMAVFHFCFDLNHYRLLKPVQFFLSDPFWTRQRVAIVSLFLLCAGAGQAVALASGQGWPRFWRRWARVALCAVGVSVGSALMFPHSWISFGVLHGVAAMLLLQRLAMVPVLKRWPGDDRRVQLGLLLVGAAAVALPKLWQHEMFNNRLLNWTGLVSQLPVAEDYVPVLPWLGVMLWGLAVGLWLLARHRQLLTGAVPAPLKPLAVLGRWSLSFYMLHQPVLLGLITAWLALAR